MSHSFHQLSTEKYLSEIHQQEYEALRLQKNRQAAAWFRWFTLALMAGVGVGIAIHQMPAWLSTVMNLFG